MDPFTTAFSMFPLRVLSMKAVSSSAHGTTGDRRDFWCLIHSTRAQNANRSTTHEPPRNKGKSQPIPSFCKICTVLLSAAELFYILSPPHFRMDEKRIITTEGLTTCLSDPWPASMGEALFVEMLYKDYMHLALATDNVRSNIVRKWCIATDQARYELMSACAGDDGVLGDMVKDLAMKHVLMVLLEPEFAEDAESMNMHISRDSIVRHDSLSIGPILFREFVQEHASIYSDKMQTYTADNVVKWWSKWDEEEKYMSMQDHADSGEMCCLWFSTYSKKAALLQILDIEFAKADSDQDEDGQSLAGGVELSEKAGVLGRPPASANYHCKLP